MDEQNKETPLNSAIDEQNTETLDSPLLLLCDETKSPSSFIEQISELEEILGYKFKDPQLLQQALTHSTYQDKVSESYERLEYVGDSVLNLLVARKDFFSYPELPPGTLTMLRAANVDREKLARATLENRLHKYLRHKKPLLDGQIETFTEAIANYPIHSHGLVDAPKVLADVMESIIGSIFIDSDSSLDITWKVVRKLLEPMVTLEMMGVHPMTKLYQMCQKNGLKVRFIDLWKETGKIQVLVDEEFIGEGLYKHKKEIAINRAAHNAYNNLLHRFLFKQQQEEEEQDKQPTQIVIS